MRNSAFTTHWSTHTIPVATGLWRLHLGAEVQVSRSDAHWHDIHRGPHSRIFRLDGATPCIAKLIIPRSQPRDSIRKYGFSQAWRETKSNRILAHLGLKTVTVYGWGVTTSPLARYESALFMQPLPKVTSGLTFIRTQQDTQLRSGFLRKLAQQLACILSHGFIHKDSHFDNVYITADQALFWIDNDLRQPRTLAGRREGMGKMLSLLKTTARADLQRHEWQFLTHELKNCLNQSPQGQELADEIS